MDQRVVIFGDTEYSLDKHGFLESADQWDENFAEGMARSLGIYLGLTDDHWKLINYVRRKFLREGTVPVVVTACAENQIRLSELRRLFPTGYHQGACKIAGINYAFLSDSNIWLTYETVPAIEAEYDVDETGFLINTEAWDEQFAQWIAGNWNLAEGLTDVHWQIIHYLHDYYRDKGSIPTLYEVCRHSGIGLEEFGVLFPKGYRRGACRAAGLPFFG